MVQKGKLALWALPELTQLKSVDLPTLGNPTIPHLRDISLDVFGSAVALSPVGLTSLSCHGGGFLFQGVKLRII